MLLIGAGLLGRSFLNLQRVAPGFDSRDVLQLTVTAPASLPRAQRAPLFHRIDDALSRVHGVAAVGATSIPPFGGAGTTSQYIAQGHEDRTNEYFAVDWRSVTPGVFKTLGVALVRGRLIETTDDSVHPNVVVIDQTMADKLWPGQNPLGKYIIRAQSERTERDKCFVVGVVKDIRDQALGTVPSATAYFPVDQTPWPQITFLIRTQSTVTPAFTKAVGAAFRQAAPATPLPELIPLARNLGTSLAPQRFTASLLTGFATIALLLAAIGLFGVVSFTVQQRTSELGVRVAFGATPGRLIRMVMREALVVVLFGAGAGCVAAAALSKFVSSLLFETPRLHAATYLGVLLMLTGCAAIASYLPARRAATVDPLTAIRAS
jgi:predicted permease